MKVQHKKILIYDGSCATCRVMMMAADKATTNYDFIDIHGEKGKKIVSEKSLAIEESAFVIDDGRVVSHSDMALEVLCDVRFVGFILVGVAHKIPLRLRDAMYK